MVPYQIYAQFQFIDVLQSFAGTFYIYCWLFSLHVLLLVFFVWDTSYHKSYFPIFKAWQHRAGLLDIQPVATEFSEQKKLRRLANSKLQGYIHMRKRVLKMMSPLSSTARTWKVSLTHEYSARSFEKNIFLRFQKSEIKCADTYEHSEAMVKISEENILYFEL
jgi:hypothetical protein